jgi:hypothetical protein
MFQLPPELQSHIWSFDSTLREIFQKSLNLIRGIRYVGMDKGGYPCTSCYSDLENCNHKDNQKKLVMNYSEYVDRIRKFFPTFYGQNQRIYNKTYIYFCKRQDATPSTHKERIFKPL